jgi:hypothetical protein
MTKEVATKKDALPTVYEGFEEFGDLGFSEVTRRRPCHPVPAHSASYVTTEK